MSTMNTPGLSRELLDLMQSMDEQFRKGWRLHRVAVLLWAKSLPDAYLALMYQRLQTFTNQLPQDIVLMVHGLGFELYQRVQVQRANAQMDMVGAATPAPSTTSAMQGGLAILGQLQKLGFAIANEVQLHEARDKCLTNKDLINTPWCSALMLTLAGQPKSAPATTPLGVTTASTTTANNNNMLMYALIGIGVALAISSQGSGQAAPYYQQQRR